MEIEITYGVAKQYRAVLIVRSFEAFAAAAQKPEIGRLEGEALIAALIAEAGKDIISINRSKNGDPNDGPSGEPAWQNFNDSGALIGAQRYRDGKLTREYKTPAEIEACLAEIKMIQRASKLKGVKIYL